MTTVNLEITRGSTFARAFFCGTGLRVFREIQDIELVAPCRIRADGHGLQDWWPVSFERVRGTTQLNRYTGAEITDGPDHIILPDFNAVGLREFGGMGVLVYDQPLPLDGFHARMHIRDEDDQLLMELTTANGRIKLGPQAGVVLIMIEAADTETITWHSGAYDLELVKGDYVCKPVGGAVTVRDEETK